MKIDLSECDPWKIGDRVVSLLQVIEEGTDGVADPFAEPCKDGWVHAEKGELGTVEHVDPGYCWPTVRWDRTQTATCVTNLEAKPV